MSLYETLGVPPDATAGTIRAAYRSLAQKHHPDREGGDHEMFQAVQKAYDILGDPERRHQYDTEGTTGQPATKHERCLALLGSVLNELLDQVGDTDFNDPIQAVRKHLHGALEEGAAMQKGITKRIQTRQKALRRAKFSGSDVNVLEMLVKGQVANLEEMMAKNEMAIDLAREVLNLLADYDYEVDLPKGLSEHDQAMGYLLSQLGPPPRGAPKGFFSFGPKTRP